MQRIAFAAIEALAGAIFFVPLLFLINKFFFRNAKITAVYCLFAFYLSSVYAIVGLPTVYNFSFDTFVYLIPFVGMIYDVKNSILNVILFIPLGIFLPLLCAGYAKLKNTLLFGFLMTLAIELLQFFTYRKTDVNDLITNTVGTLFGFLIARLIIKKIPQTQVNGKMSEIFTVTAVTVCVMFLFQPFLSCFLWSFIR